MRGIRTKIPVYVVVEEGEDDPVLDEVHVVADGLHEQSHVDADGLAPLRLPHGQDEHGQQFLKLANACGKLFHYD